MRKTEPEEASSELTHPLYLLQSLWLPMLLESMGSHACPKRMGLGQFGQLGLIGKAVVQARQAIRLAPAPLLWLDVPISVLIGH